jgi:hypothetical protein
MQNTDGIDSNTDITLSGESSAYFDTLNCGTFQGVDGDFFTGVTSNIQTQIDGISGSLSSTYVTLTTTQNISGGKTFTTNPSCTATASTSNHLIKKGTADGLYGQLATTNTWTQINTFSRGIVPRRNLGDGTDYQISSNAMLNRQGGSTNNIGIGISTLEGDNISAGYFYNTGSRNTACGHFALQKLDGGNDSVAIGYQALQNAGGQRIYGAGITPNRCVAIGSGSQKTNLYGSDCISIGFNSLSNVGSGTGNIVLGSNVGGGLGNVGSNVVIGTSAMPTATDNGIVCIGLNALRFATGQCNRGVFIGESAGQSNNNGSANTFIGGQSGTANTTGGQNICIGTFSGRLSSATGNYMVCIGYDSKAIQSNEFVLGGESFTERAELTLPNKTRLVCNQEYTSGTTINLSFRTNENIVLSANTITTLNLPSITGSQNIGAKFHIYRAIQTTNSVLINAAAGQSVDYVRSDGVYVTIPSGGSFPIYFNDPYAEIICVTTTKWLVLCRVLAQATNTVNISTNLVPGVTTYSIPFGVSGGASTSTFTTLMNDTGLTFDTTTDILTTPSLTTTTSLNTTGSFIVSSYRPYEMGSIAGSATALPGLPTLYGTYFWTASTTAATNTIITLPTITASMTGVTLRFRRLTYASTNTLIIKTPAGGATIMVRNNVTAIAANTNYTLLDTTTTITGTHAVLMAESTTRWVVLF